MSMFIIGLLCMWESWALQVAYHLNLPAQLGHVHNVFHVSMLKKYTLDSSHVIQYVNVLIQEDVSYEEQPVRLLARELKVLRNREIPLVKVLWEHHKEDKTTWELETEMKVKYPELFENSSIQILRMKLF